MKLAELLDALPRFELRGDADVDIGSIELDSRRVSGGALFVCLEGLARNGHDFAATAVAQGAAALVVRRPLDTRVPQVVVPDSREALARVSAAFHRHPSRELTLVGVTGTNGKTTVTHLIMAIAQRAGHAAEVLGTLGGTGAGGYRATGFTTPEAPALQKLLREAADRGTSWMAMEVSSHALSQKRIFGTEFAGVVFTNLTRDHLDFHGSMEAYGEAKALLFSRRGRGSLTEAVSVVNLDDPAGPSLLAKGSGRKVTYGLGHGSDYRARRIRVGTDGSRYELVTPRGRAEASVRLLGRFNVVNALAAQATALELGLSLEAALLGVEDVERVSGRMESVPGPQPFLVLVDYAHTPDALVEALRAARGLTSAKLTVVFGCGGDRDPGKRADMGRAASRLADQVILTSDNPRSEDPEAILDAVMQGILPSRQALREPDRARAIRIALEGAGPGDTVLIAGKGHETEQIIGKERLPFDDRRVAREALRELGYRLDD